MLSPLGSPSLPKQSPVAPALAAAGFDSPPETALTSVLILFLHLCLQSSAESVTAHRPLAGLICLRNLRACAR